MKKSGDRTGPFTDGNAMTWTGKTNAELAAVSNGVVGDNINTRLSDLEGVVEKSLEAAQRIESAIGTTPVPCAQQSTASDSSVLGRIRDAYFQALEIGSALGRIQETLGIKPD